MFLRKATAVLIGLLIFKTALAQDTTASMGKVKLTFLLDDDGKPSYTVTYGSQVVIKPSALGIKLLNDVALDHDFELLGTEKKDVDSLWYPVWGEESKIR